MSRNHVIEKNIKTFKEKAATARSRMSQATTTQERQHFEGMARYWEELFDELSATAGASADADDPQRAAG
jgi:hypothetical protein